MSDQRDRGDNRPEYNSHIQVEGAKGHLFNVSHTNSDQLW